MFEPPRFTPTAIRFFAKFSRFEFAMKNIQQYRRVKQNNGSVEPNWDNFANFLFAKENRDEFFATLNNDAKTKYLLHSPPRKRLVNAHGQLDWSDPPLALQDIREVCTMVRRVRNNLAHGDKAHPGAERNRKLLSAATTILDRMLTDNVELQHFF
jgi:hypothetical protein